MTDDQTLEAMRVLDNVDRYLVDQGTSFTNYFVGFPNCCPSRATFMSGQYNHNNGIRENIRPAGGYGKFDNAETLQVWLQRAGYWTAHLGKYLNEYGEGGDISAPPGWSHWFGLIDPTTYRYYNYSISNNGQRLDYGADPEHYQTDVLGAEAVRVIEERGSSGHPWFLSWNPLAPHATEGEGEGGTARETGGNTVVENIRATLPDPAPEFAGKMSKERLPRPPSFNEPDVSDKPQFIQQRLPMFTQSQELVREGYQRELETLLSVDKWVKRMMEALIATNQVADTVVIFTSDNGYFHGEHRLAFGKVQLYEPAVHLPLIIRGGPFPKAAKVPTLTGNVDLVPTILALAGATATKVLDGRDLAPFAQDPKLGESRVALLENWRNHGNKHAAGIRTARHKLLVHDTGEEELYDLEADPHELDNRARDPLFATVKADLAGQLEALRRCRGDECRRADGGPAPAA